MTVVEPPKRCYECEHFCIDRSLQYYNIFKCRKSGNEIRFGSENGWDRMKWCPIAEDKKDDDEP